MARNNRKSDREAERKRNIKKYGSWRDVLKEGGREISQCRHCKLRVRLKGSTEGKTCRRCGASLADALVIDRGHP